MKLFYVEHSVVVTKHFALIAADEDDLKRLLAEREAAVHAAPFTSKVERDKSGKPIGHQLNADWTYAPHGPTWDGTAKKE